MRYSLVPLFTLLAALSLSQPASADGSFAVTGSCCASFTFASTTDPSPGANPTLTLKRGSTYTFTSATGATHPFCLRTAAGGTNLAAGDGVTGNCGATNSSTTTWTIPANAANTYAYQCQFHAPMTGVINIIDPPPPVTAKRIVPTLTIAAAALLGVLLVISGAKASRKPRG